MTSRAPLRLVPPPAVLRSHRRERQVRLSDRARGLLTAAVLVAAAALALVALVAVN
jgi:hypothetical protein